MGELGHRFDLVLVGSREDDGVDLHWVQPEILRPANTLQNLAKAMPAWRSAQQAVVKTLGEQRWSVILSDLDRAALALTQ